MLRIALLVTCSVLLSVSFARAETVTVEGPPFCVKPHEFVGELAHRRPERDLKSGPKGPIAVRFFVEEGAVTATLELHLEDGSTLRRSIDAPSCQEAQEAILFITAVALDPGAQDPVQLESEIHEKKEEVPVPQPEPLQRWRPGVGLVASALLGATPEALIGGQVYGSLTAEHVGWWAPSFRFGGAYFFRRSFEQESGTAAFYLGALSGQACPSQLGVGRLRIRPCALLQGGILWASGEDTFEPQEVRRPWMGVGAELVLDVQLVENLFLTGRGGAVVPLVRDSFSFDEIVFYEVSPLIANLEGGLEVRF